MRRFPFAVGAVLLLGPLCLLPIPTYVQAANLVDENIDTLDRVRLKGQFAPGKAKAPCVILLPSLSGTRKSKGWSELTEALTKKEYAVLTFDFRGYGDSTTILKPDTFWNVSTNKTYVKYNKDSRDKFEKVEKSAYKPFLTNDIAAVKHFLEERASGNVGSIVLIGAEEGAGLGALWMAAEWQRKPIKKFNNALGEYWAPDPLSDVLEGEDIACCVWLTMPDKVAGTKVSSWLTSSKFIRDKVPMAFFYGEKDREGAEIADKLVRDVKKNGKKEDLEFTTTRKKATDAKGANLLLKDGTVDDIVKYIDKCMEKRDRPERGKREIPPEPVQVTLRNLVSGW